MGKATLSQTSKLFALGDFRSWKLNIGKWLILKFKLVCLNSTNCATPSKFQICQICQSTSTQLSPKSDGFSSQKSLSHHLMPPPRERLVLTVNYDFKKRSNLCLSGVYQIVEWHDLILIIMYSRKSKLSAEGILCKMKIDKKNKQTNKKQRNASIMLRIVCVKTKKKKKKSLRVQRL